MLNVAWRPDLKTLIDGEGGMIGGLIYAHRTSLCRIIHIVDVKVRALFI
jgi:hypothetical protein